MSFYSFVGLSLITIKDKLHDEDVLDGNDNKTMKTSNRIVKSKPNLTKSGEFQLSGEMVATAMHNYTHKPKLFS
jgi:hypothetical protein